MLTASGEMKVKQELRSKKEEWLNVPKANDVVSETKCTEINTED